MWWLTLIAVLATPFIIWMAVAGYRAGDLTGFWLFMVISAEVSVGFHSLSRLLEGLA